MKSAAKLGSLVLLSIVFISACQNNGGDNTTPTATYKWAWASGSKTVNQVGVYGSQGEAAASNVPGAREDALSWLDPAGKFWLFGGYAYDAVGNRGRLNDLWQFDPTSTQWTWISGANTINQAGLYGTKGTAAPSNIPGARTGAVSWTDAQGTLWLFGGLGYPEIGDYGDLNDLWKFDPAIVEWTWVSGANTINQAGVYGTKGTAAPTNIPGARTGAVSWIDSQGLLWLFGGYGYDSAGHKGWLNDLWRYDPTSLEWTWISGSDANGNAGTFGTRGTADPLNVPSGRYMAVSWFDPGGRLWLFGGDGLDSTGARGYLTDLWKYDLTTLEWTWVSGSNARNQAGAYGTKGAAAAAFYPGARMGAVSWIDAQGILWLFGGYGYYLENTSGWLNDLWKYDPTALMWTWMSGSESGGQAGAYGTQGTPDSANVPGARYSAESWIDSQGLLWIFGGYGSDSAGTGGWLNDLWRSAK